MLRSKLARLTNYWNNWKIENYWSNGVSVRRIHSKYKKNEHITMSQLFKKIESRKIFLNDIPKCMRS